MELLPRSYIAPTVRLLSQTLRTHFHARPQDGLLPIFTDLIFQSAVLDHPAMDHSRLVEDLSLHIHLPRPSLTAPAYAHLVSGASANDQAGPVPVLNPAALEEGTGTAVDQSHKPLVFSLLSVRKLLMAIQSLPDTWETARRAMEQRIVSHHLMEEREFLQFSAALRDASGREDPEEGQAAAATAAVSTPAASVPPWWKPVRAPPPSSMETIMDAAPYLQPIDIEWKDKPILWGIAAQMANRHLAEVMMYAFNLPDHDLESSPMQSHVVFQQRVLAYLVTTSAMRSDRESLLSPPHPLPLFCRPLSPQSSALLLLQHFLGEETGWRWCAEALLHLQSGRIAKAGATNTVVDGAGGNSSIAPQSSALATPTASAELLAMERSLPASTPADHPASSTPSNFIRVGSVYSTALMLAGATKTWRTDIVPPALLLSCVSSSLALLGTAACPDYFVVPNISLLFEYTAVLFQLQPQREVTHPELSSAPEKSSHLLKKEEEEKVEEEEDDDEHVTLEMEELRPYPGTDTLLPSRVRQALIPVLRQTLWFFHTQGMLDGIADLYLFSATWIQDVVSTARQPPQEVLGKSTESPSTTEADAGTPSELSSTELLALQMQYRWKRWVQQHIWLFPVLLRAARSQLSVSNRIIRPEPSYTASSSSNSSSGSTSLDGSSNAHSSFVLPEAPQPTVLAISAAAALSLETLLSGLMSAVMLWKRQQSPGARAGGALLNPLTSIQPLLRRIVVQYLPSRHTSSGAAKRHRQDSTSVSNSLTAHHWKYRHVVYLVAILNTLLFQHPPVLSLVMPNAAEATLPPPTVEEIVEKIPEHILVSSADLASLLAFSRDRLSRAESELDYLRTRGAPRDISVLILHASELLQSDVRGLARHLHLSARPPSSSGSSGHRAAEPASTTRPAPGPHALQPVLLTCWELLETGAAAGEYSPAALELLLLKAQRYQTQLEDCCPADASVETAAPRQAVARAAVRALKPLKEALARLPTRSECPIYA